MKHLIITIILIFCSTWSYGQKNTIKGTVRDINNEPIIGVNIQVKNTGKGTITDVDGKYSIEISKSDTIIFSYMGYQQIEVSSFNSETKNIILKEDSQMLNEVVAIGYGVQKKVNLTGAVDLVKGDEISQIPHTSSATALQGRLSGVFINSPSGSPGGDSNTQILIRGIGTLNDASPLILVDGLECSVDNFMSMNVNDIESVSVLKDASSSAIYGNRAANGVLLVTTKKGDKSKASISYNGNYGVHKAINLPKLMNSWEFLEWTNSGQIKHDKPIVADEETLNKYKSGEDPFLYPNYQPYDIFLRNGQETSHNISVRGSEGILSYYGSFGHKTQNGVEIKNSYKQTNIRVNLNAKFFNQKLDVNFIQTFNNTDSDLPPTNINTKTGKMNKSSVLGLAIKQSPKSKVVNRDGSFAEENYGMYFSGGYVDNKKKQNYTKISSTYNINKNNSITIEYAHSNTQNDNLGVIPEYSIITNFENNPKEEVFDSRMIEYISDQQYSNLGIFGNSSFFIKRHTIKGLLGFSCENWKDKWHSINGTKLVDASIPSINNITGDVILNSFAFEKAMVSGFGRINYNFDEKYLAEFTLRMDGSSTFLKGNRWGVFPSASVGWRISEESFLKGNNTIRNLKLRMSYGQLGNDKVPIYSVYNTISSTVYYAFNNSSVTGSKVDEIGNKDLTWEKATDINGGIDLQLFDKLFFTMDVFNKKTSNILQKTTAPSLFGYNGVGTIANLASMENKGYEMSIEHLNNIRSFRYGVKFNFSYVKNRVTKLFIDTSESDYMEVNKGWNIIKKGEPFNALYGYQVAGIIQSKEEAQHLQDIYAGKAASEGYAITGIETWGDWYYVDRNNDGKIDDEDKVVLGSPFPKWQGSSNIMLGYKGFEVNLFFQGVWGNKIYSNGTMVDPYMSGSAKVADLFNTWTPDNTSSNIPWADGMKSKITPNDYYVENASYLRLKNIIISYNLPKKYISKAFVKECKLSFSVSNIFTITNYRYFDPETTLNSTNSDFNYPQTRAWNVGVRMSF